MHNSRLILVSGCDPDAPTIVGPALAAPISPRPLPNREGSGAPPFMLPAYHRRRNVGRTYK